MIAAIRKEAQLVWADRGGLLALFVMPVAFMAVFGSVFAGPAGGASSPASMLTGASGFQLAVPGNAVLFGFFLALTIAISFLEERRSGVFRRLLSAPVSRRHLLWAKLVPYVLIGAVQMLFFFVFGVAVLGLKIGGSVLALSLLTLAVVACATSLGLLIASFSGTQKQVGGIGSIVLLIMGLLGGAMVPRLAMPPIMQDIGLVTPHAWALEGYYQLLLFEGTGIADVAKEIIVVLLFASAFGILGAMRFRFHR